MALFEFVGGFYSENRHLSGHQFTFVNFINLCYLVSIFKMTELSHLHSVLFLYVCEIFSFPSQSSSLSVDITVKRKSTKVESKMEVLSVKFTGGGSMPNGYFHVIKPQNVSPCNLKEMYRSLICPDAILECLNLFMAKTLRLSKHTFIKQGIYKCPASGIYNCQGFRQL